mgnify:CR=1 FL=1
MDILFGNIMENGSFTAGAYLAATAVSLLLGALVAWVWSRKHAFTRSFLISLILLPAIVQMVIMMVNGNIGAGVATAGAFSLVRFRSVAGKAEEITAIFLVMGIGLATGMGYLGVAVLFAVILCAAVLLLELTGRSMETGGERILRITISESLDYENLFDDVFDKFTSDHSLQEVRTANMGSLYRLSYRIVMKAGVSGKEMIDELRVRNGNLEISCGRPVENEISL